METQQNFNLYEFTNYNNGSVLLAHKGPMDEYIIASLGNYLKNLAVHCNGIKDRLFKVFMELVQNVSLYSEETITYDKKKTIGIGTFVLLKLEDSYFLHIGNVVDRNKIDPIIEKCNKINTLDRDGLREFKRQERSKPYSSSGGGNIGLIEVALNTENQINYKISHMENNQVFFDICVKFQCK